MCEEMKQFDPLRILTSTREDFEDGIRFAQKRGFTERMRDWESRLDPASISRADWNRYPQRIAEQGIEIKTVVELESDPNRDRKLYELEWLIDRDIPSPEPPSKVPFEEFQKVWEWKNLVPNSWFVALDNGEYVGTTNLWEEPSRCQRTLYWHHRRDSLPSHAGYRDGFETSFYRICPAGRIR